MNAQEKEKNLRKLWKNLLTRKKDFSNEDNIYIETKIKNNYSDDINSEKTYKEDFKNRLRYEINLKNDKKKRLYTDLTAVCLEYMCGKYDVNTLEYVWCVNEHHCF